MIFKYNIHILHISISTNKTKMHKQYIVITESRHSGWVGYECTLAKAKRLLKMEGEVFYIFKCVMSKEKTIRIKFPLSEYYSCLEINNFVREDIESDYLEITKTPDCEYDSLILTHSN